MRLAIAPFALSFLAACGGGTSNQTSGSETNATSTPTPTRPAWEVHEWGLVDVVAATGATEIAAGPGRPGTPGPTTHPIDRPVITRKPVLYVHLGPELDSLTFRATVSLPGGHIVEHWPAATLATDGLTWDGVAASRGACGATSARDDQPARRGLVACGTEDGYCEVQDLPRYVTRDADCLSVAGTEANLLFYRGASTNPALPVRATRDANLRVSFTSDTPMAGAPSAVYRITARTDIPGLQDRAHVSEDPSRGRVAVRDDTASVGRESLDPATTLFARRGRMPPPGATANLESPDEPLDAPALRTSLIADLRALGLTEDEARAFMDAWATELFVTPHASDVLLYWLTPTAIDRLAQLRFEPEPTTVRRAMLVRVDLGPSAAPRLPTP